MEIPIKGNIASKTEFLPANEKHSRFNSLKLFLAALSCLYFAKALSGSYMKSTITQIERRFDIPSSLIGVVDGSFEIGNLLVIVFVSYFGAKFHRPRIIAIGSMVMAIGTFLTASPHFFMGRYNYETALTFSSNLTMSISQCSNTSKDMTTPAPEENSSGCERAAGSSMWMYIFLGNLLRGIGETPTGPLGISYLDDFATQENTSFYIGILYAVALIGPLFGYLLGSFCAKLFVDIGFVDLERVTITSKDARWVGAWWLGFLIAGAFSLLFSIPFWFFPKSLTKETRKKELGKASEKIDVLIPEQSFLSSVKTLFSNSIFVLYLVSMVLQLNALIGMLTFKPKFIEQQYGQSASRSNFLIGLINIPAVCVGFFLGGYVMKRLKLNIVQAAKLSYGCSTLGWLITLSFFAMGCENSRVAGLTVSYQGTAQVSFGGSALNHDCNTGCFCSLKQWEPICAGDGVTYVSPCLAGCTTSTGTGKNTVRAFDFLTAVRKQKRAMWANQLYQHLHPKHCQPTLTTPLCYFPWHVLAFNCLYILSFNVDSFCLIKLKSFPNLFVKKSLSPSVLILCPLILGPMAIESSLLLFTLPHSLFTCVGLTIIFPVSSEGVTH
ncbi:hypothetical protein chiPu_0015921 [Chiloscyllium punctatum]|uniref:Solute carrier organic anion transporter family member n=1 Tax=Chiloscyllium punctatum TaxID=137246 RepID=A0A401T475_CHIPU|nr:hypothetical protein [Chiloscyllium punctatum]